MTTDAALLAAVRQINGTAAFNRWCGIALEADVGRVAIEMPWRAEAGRYTGFLHAGPVGAPIDAACGFAAATVAAPRLPASRYAVNCLRPAVGNRFSARARVVKPGRTLIFTTCAPFTLGDGGETLVATGDTLPAVVSR